MSVSHGGIACWNHDLLNDDVSIQPAPLCNSYNMSSFSDDTVLCADCLNMAT